MEFDIGKIICWASAAAISSSIVFHCLFWCWHCKFFRWEGESTPAWMADIQCWSEREANKQRRIRLPDTHAERVDNIQKQNDRAYRAIEFYFKISLAILGGYFYILTNQRVFFENDEFVRQLIGWLQIFMGFGFSGIIFLHFRSKVERWTKRSGRLAPFVIMEHLLIIIMMVYAFGRNAALPHIKIKSPTPASESSVCIADKPSKAKESPQATLPIITHPQVSNR